MREVDFDIKDGAPLGAVGVDWRETPAEILNQVDGLLEELKMEVVVYKTYDDTIIFSIEKRNE